MTVALDGSKKSPIVLLSNGNLTATFSTAHYGNVAADTAVPAAKSWYEVTPSTIPSGGTLFFGFATASHYFGNDNQAWGGGDAFLSGVYINAGGAWPAGQGYAYHDDDAGTATTAGETWMIERDSAITTDSYGTSSPNGVFRVRKGAFTSRWYVLPSGTLYGIIGSDSGAVVATLNFGASSPVNSVGSGYSAYDGGGGGSVVSVSGTAAGVSTAAATVLCWRSLQGTSAGASTASGSSTLTLALEGTAGAGGAVSGTWASGGVLPLVATSQGMAQAAAAGSFPGGERWAPAAVSPETWAPAPASPAAWEPMAATLSAWIRVEEPHHG